MPSPAGQIAQVGAQVTLNHLAGVVVPVVQSTAPTWVPGLYWVDNTGGGAVVKSWNGTAWAAATGARYLALLSADPGEPAVMGDITEILTPGYARQSVSFTNATTASPSVVQNSNTITFGPMTADMTLAAGWAVLVSTISGTSGWPLYAWKLTLPQLVSTSQTIMVAAGSLQMYC